MIALGVLIAFSLAPIVASALPPPGLIVVSPSSLAGWVPTTSADGGLLTASDAFVTGPGSAPVGSGSWELSVGSNGDGGVQVRHAGYTGVLLSSLTALNYWTYVSSFNGCQAPYLILNVDTNGDGSTDDLLFFEPCYQTGSYGGDAVPAQGAPVLGAWQHWNALDGGWWTLNDGFFGPPLVTLGHYILDHPGVQIVNSLTGGGVRIAVGFGAGAWDNFVGNADAFTIGVGATTTTYDFEPSASRVHLDIGSNGVVDLDFGTIQSAVNAGNPGDTVLVDPGTFPELVVITKSITLLGAQAGIAGWAHGGAPESVVGTSDGAFQVLANNVVIDGFEITGVDGSSGISSLGAGVWTSGATSGHVIRNNIIHDNTIGVYLNSDGTFPSLVSHNLLRDNNVAGAASGDAIYSDLGAVNVEIDANHFTGHESAAMVFAGGFSPPGGVQSNLAITNNEFADDAGSVVLFNAGDVLITGNSWTGSLGSSVFLGGGVDGVTIVRNDFLSGDFRALRVWAGASGETGQVANVAFHENNVVGNLEGINVVAGSYLGILGADCNWWGAPSGPAAATNLGGLGDAVVDPSAVVHFVPWLSVSAPAPCGGLGGGPVHLDIGSDGSIEVNFGTIQPAVTTAGNGDTVYVDPGVYTEQVVIDAGVRLRSTVPQGATILAPPFASRHTFTLASSGRTWDAIVEIKDANAASIEGFVIDGNGEGGFCSGRSFTGIMMHGGVDMTARSNVIVGMRDMPFSGCQAGFGIAVYPDAPGNPASAEIAGNSIIRYQKGGIVVNVEGAMADVHDNLVVGSGATDLIAQNGIQFGFGAGGSALRNTVTRTAYTGGYWTSAGILLYGAADGVAIENNLLEDDQIGVDVWDSAGVHVAGNYVAGVLPGGFFSSCGGPLGTIDLFGIHFQDSSGTIAHNEVRDIRFQPGARGCQSGDGIVLDGATQAMVGENTVVGYQKTGIVAGRFSNDVDDSLLDADITGNTVVGWGMTDLIAQNGIQVADGAMATVHGNDVSGNWYSPCGDYLTCYNAAGILVDESSGVLVHDNTLTGNQAGINLYAADSAVLDSNMVSGSAWAIIVDSSDGVRVSGNTIGVPTVPSGAVQIVGAWALDSTNVQVEGNDLDFGGNVASVGTLYGIFFQDSSGTISGNDVLNVRMSDSNFGIQTGVGIIATGTGNVDINSNRVQGYQKGGIVVGRAAIPFVGSFNVLDNSVIGHGPTPLTAQNGIQVSGPEAVGTVRGNHISGNDYTGCSNHDAAHNGCTPYVAAGLLLYNVHSNDVKHSNNEFTDNQRDLILVTSQSLGF